MATVTKPRPKRRPKTNKDDVFDLRMAAKYLRLPEAAIIEAVQKQQLPGREIQGEWRFLKSAIQLWLSVPPKPDFWTTQFGAFKDDPYLEQMVAEIYANRGRPICEEP